MRSTVAHEIGVSAPTRAVTAEECRVRFAQLDREDGADAGAGVGADVTDTSCAAAPGVLENAGLSFSDLEKKARTMKSRYLCVVCVRPEYSFVFGDVLLAF